MILTLTMNPAVDIGYTVETLDGYGESYSKG